MDPVAPSPAAPPDAATPASALPALIPDLPDAARRSGAGPFAGSSDALALADLARKAVQAKRMVAVISAEPRSAQRLVEEIPWFAPELRVHLLPDWETLPYDHFSPHQDLISERLATLYRAARGECDVLVVPRPPRCTALAPPSYLAAFTFFLKHGEKLDVDALREQLTLAGYTHVQQVLSPGEYCVRGGLIDLFPMGSVLPYRIDLFDDEIETIATFDVDTQRTLYPVPKIRLLPAREFPLDEAGRTRFRRAFANASRATRPGRRSTRTSATASRPAASNITCRCSSKRPRRCSTTCRRPPLCAAPRRGRGDRRFWQDAASRYNLLRGDPERPLLEPTELFLTVDAFNGALKIVSAASSCARRAPGPRVRCRRCGGPPRR